MPAIVPYGVKNPSGGNEEVTPVLVVDENGDPASLGGGGGDATNAKLDELKALLGGVTAWTFPARFTTTPATAGDLLAAALATKAVIIENLSAAETVNVRWDGSAASATVGKPLAPGGTLVIKGNVPTGKFSVYSTNAATLSVAYA